MDKIFINNLLNNINIVEIIKNHIKLKKKGSNYVGLCPFHEEKTPSFTVNNFRKIYHCFGCGEHGNIINFLIKYQNSNFIDVMKDLCQKTGITLPNKNIIEKKNNFIENEKIYKIFKIINNFYKKQLLLSSDAQKYLKNRNLSEEIINKFEIGYSPNISIYYILSKNNLLKDINFNNPSYYKKYFDIFKSRITFPIKNYNGKIIAFGARTIINNKIKYLNSPETNIFKKSHELYGLYEAKKEIQKKGYILVTEGYIDVIKLHQFGFTNTVAILGSICSITQIEKIFQITNKIIFNFDGDEAGKLAALKILKECIKYKIDEKIIKFIFLPLGYDPDNYIQKIGKKNFEIKIENAIPLSKILIKIIIGKNNLNTLEGCINTQLEAKKIINTMPKSLFKNRITSIILEITKANFFKKNEIFNLNTKTSNKYIPFQNHQKISFTLIDHLICIFIIYPNLYKKLNLNTLNIIKKLDFEKSKILINIIKIYKYTKNKNNYLKLIKPFLKSKNIYHLMTKKNIKYKIKYNLIKLEINDIIKKIK